jgi:hypothetical protein
MEITTNYENAFDSDSIYYKKDLSPNSLGLKAQTSRDSKKSRLLT